MKRKMFFLLVLGLVLLPLLTVRAQTTSGRISFTAMLGPPFPGDFRFNIIDASANVLYGPDDQPGLAVDVATGRLHAAVGAGTGGDVPASILQGNDTLFITVEDLTAPGVILATVQINSSGYAHFALGITDNAVTTTNIQDSAVTSAKIAAGSVDSSKIADGSIGASHVDSTQVQRRVIGSCDVGNAIRVINDAGTVTCEPTGGGGGVTAVTASAPLVSSGGATPNISLPNVIVGTTNTAIGISALSSNTTGRDNTASGRSALQSNTMGSANTASGVGALFRNTTGFNNTASGVQALVSNTTGNNNTASGVNALQNNTIGINNTASGLGALFTNTTGDNNTASGRSALQNNTIGINNTATGTSALGSNSTGNNNIASGFEALRNNTTGGGNTASGWIALLSNTTGSNNTAIGAGANVSVGNLFNATAIGANAVVNATNKVRIGNTFITRIEGQVGFTASSDRNQKENFQPVDGEEVLRKLRGFSLTSWNFIGHDPKEFRHYGLMAQDFFAAFGHDGIGAIGTPTTITSTDMDGVLMIAAQALEKRTVEQRKEINALRAENTELKTRLEALERLVKGTQTAQLESSK